jgi:hypothetical protein
MKRNNHVVPVVMNEHQYKMLCRLLTSKMAELKMSQRLGSTEYADVKETLERIQSAYEKTLEFEQKKWRLQYVRPDGMPPAK